MTGQPLLTLSSMLTISGNERPKAYVDTIRQVVGEDKTAVGPLKCADYAVGTRVGVERKRTGNLVSSLTKTVHQGTDQEDKELWDQMRRCLETYQRVYLLVEGSLEMTTDPKACYAEGRYRKVGWVAVQSALNKVQEMGVWLVWTRDIGETALWLKWMHGKTRKL